MPGMAGHMVAFDLGIFRIHMLSVALAVLNCFVENAVYASEMSLRSQLLSHLTVPATIGTAPRGEAASCTDLLLQAAWASECTNVANSTEVKVVVCQNSSNRGLVLLFPGHDAESSNPLVNISTFATNVSEHKGQHVYRLRIIGPEVLLPAIHYCQGFAVSKYALEANGTWHFEVLLLYDNFTIPPPPRLRSDVHAAAFTVNVTNATTSQSTCFGEDCVLCSSHSMPGRWVVKQHIVVDALRSTCAKGKWQEPNCTDHNAELAKDSSGMLVWHPYTCRYQRFHHPAVVAQCLAKLQRERQICIIGDSQMRHLHGMLVQILDSSAAHTFYSLVAGRKGATVKNVMTSNRATYVDDSYGGQHDTSACRHVFVNFGQWPLAFTTWKHPNLNCATGPEGCHRTRPGEPWSLDRYAEQVEKVARHMLDQQLSHNNSQYWVTINSIPIIENWHQDEGYDWRTEPMLLTYNRIAATIMQQHGIPVVDTYSISSPVNDLSYDRAHYIGNIGYAQARMILHIACPGT